MKKLTLLISLIALITITVQAQNFGIDEPNPSEKLDVNGNIKASGLAGSDTRNVVADSDGKLVAEEPVIFQSWMVGPDFVIPGGPTDTIPFNQAMVNLGNGFNASNGVFTAPEDGLYEFSFSATVFTNGGGQTYCIAELWVDGSPLHQTAERDGDASFINISFTYYINLASGSTVWVGARGPSGVIRGSSYRPVFNGKKIN